jgi:hypothetical protein
MYAGAPSQKSIKFHPRRDYSLRGLFYIRNLRTTEAVSKTDTDTGRIISALLPCSDSNRNARGYQYERAARTAALQDKSLNL